MKVKLSKFAKDGNLWASVFQYGECPHCKKMVIWSTKDGVKALEKWKKQKKIKK